MSAMRRAGRIDGINSVLWEVLETDKFKP